MPGPRSRTAIRPTAALGLQMHVDLVPPRGLTGVHHQVEHRGSEHLRIDASPQVITGHRHRLPVRPVLKKALVATSRISALISTGCSRGGLGRA